MERGGEVGGEVMEEWGADCGHPTVKGWRCWRVVIEEWGTDCGHLSGKVWKSRRGAGQWKNGMLAA